MFFSKQVLIGVLGAPSDAGAVYDWMLIVGGDVGGTPAGVRTTNKYTFGTGGSNGSVAAAASIPAGSTARFFAGAFGNKTVGLFCGGTTGTASSADVDTFTNATETWTAGVDLSSAKEGHEGSSSTTYGYLFGGWTVVNTTRRYEYSSTSWVTNGGNITQSKAWMAAHNNATIALISGGYTNTNQTVQEVYTFATDTSSTSGISALAAATREMHATGDNTNSYIMNGTIAGDALTVVIRKNALSTGAAVTTINNGVASRFADGASNGTKGVWGSFAVDAVAPYSAGEAVRSNTTREIDFSTDTLRTGTNLTYTAWLGGAFSGAQVA
jgi:hypothetical protein